MKKFMGINRNKFEQFQLCKISTHKRKNRFKINKDEQDQLSQGLHMNSLTSTTQNSVSSEHEASKAADVYEEAKDNLKHAYEYKRKFTDECKLRITAFKESQTKKYDDNIAKHSRKAIEHLLLAEKTLAQIKNMKGFTQSQQKYYRNMQKSLALQLRQCSKQLRAQQKQHFERLRAYQKGTVNTAIQLSETQKQNMKSDDTFEFEQQTSQAVLQLSQNGRNSQINELVQSINKLSSIYKELNQLIIQQGSLIDRIDVNIEDTYTHVQRGNEHLRGAEENASSPFAQKCMIVLISAIVIMALILGFKYSK